jgi:hypothetical protein
MIRKVPAIPSTHRLVFAYHFLNRHNRTSGIRGMIRMRKQQASTLNHSLPVDWIATKQLPIKIWVAFPTYQALERERLDRALVDPSPTRHH